MIASDLVSPMPKFSFEVEKKDKHTNARAGVILTKHGEIQTPAFVPVGTQATVKSLDSYDLEKIGVQVFFVNTYHMILRPGLEAIERFAGLHKFISWNKPLMTDSAGFQIFSLGGSKRLKVVNAEVEPSLVEISEEGVVFRSHLDGSKLFFSPEESISAQTILGADILVAFDECTFYPATYQYSRKAMERTHRWALRCLNESAKCKAQSAKFDKGFQALYGVVQGSVFEDLRKKSAKFIGNLPFEGIAIGGVSVGESKEEMRSVLKCVVPNLPDQKPRHLLGVGEIDDIFALVEAGVDTFDCVMPTRLGRMGHILINGKLKMENGKGEKFTMDITKAEYAKDKRPIDEECECEVCQNYSRAYINHLFRAKELLAYRLASYHNIYFVEKLVGNIRKSIKEGKFLELKKEFF